MTETRVHPLPMYLSKGDVRVEMLTACCTKCLDLCFSNPQNHELAGLCRLGPKESCSIAEETTVNTVGQMR